MSCIDRMRIEQSGPWRRFDRYAYWRYGFVMFWSLDGLFDKDGFDSAPNPLESRRNPLQGHGNFPGKLLYIYWLPKEVTCEK